VDVDLFRPTRDALEFFYPRLVPEGTIVVDDYSWRNFPGARAGVDGFVSEHSPRFFLPLQAGGCVIVR
jgi:hypothetical protein